MTGHRMEFTESENPWAPTAAVAEINVHTGSGLELVGLADQAGGTSVRTVSIAASNAGPSLSSEKAGRSSPIACNPATAVACRREPTGADRAAGASSLPASVSQASVAQSVIDVTARCRRRT